MKKNLLVSTSTVAKREIIQDWTRIKPRWGSNILTFEILRSLTRLWRIDKDVILYPCPAKKAYVATHRNLFWIDKVIHLLWLHSVKSAHEVNFRALILHIHMRHNNYLLVLLALRFITLGDCSKGFLQAIPQRGGMWRSLKNLTSGVRADSNPQILNS